MSEPESRGAMTDRTYRVAVGPTGHLGACLHVAPGESESRVAVVEHTLAPGRLGAALHRHSREDAVSLVYAGEMTFLEEGETLTAVTGDVLVKQRGRWHAFWNAGDETLRFYELVVPGEFAWYFADVAPYLADSGFPADGARASLSEIDAAYGLEVDRESVPELLAEHDLER